MMDTIDRILDLLQKRGIRQKELAKELNLGEDNISVWKKGKSKSYTKYIYQIAEYLDTSVAYLMCETDDPTPPDKKKASSEIEDAENRMIYDELKSVGIDLAVISDEEYERLLLFIDRNRDLILEHTRLNDKN